MKAPKKDKNLKIGKILKHYVKSYGEKFGNVMKFKKNWRMIYRNGVGIFTESK